MRIIPKNTKVKLQFYKGIGLYDIIIGVVALAFVALAASSNLPNKYFIAIGILAIVAPMYIPLGDIKLYQALGYVFKFGIAQKSFSITKHGNSHISVVVPYSSIKEDLIFQKNGGYTGVI